VLRQHHQLDQKTVTDANHSPTNGQSNATEKPTELLIKVNWQPHERGHRDEEMEIVGLRGFSYLNKMSFYRT